MTQLFANNAAGTLNAAITAAATSIVLTSGNGANFPAPNAPDWFYATLIGYDGNGNENSWEVVKVTANASDTLTVARSQDGTTAPVGGWAAATRIEIRGNAGTMQNFMQKAGDSATGKMHFTATDSAATALGNVSGAVSIDCSAADQYSLTPTATTTLSFTNPPAAGKSQVVLLKITNGGLQTVSFQSGTKYPGGALGTLTSSGTDWLGVAYDADLSAWVVFVLGKAVA